MSDILRPSFGRDGGSGPFGSAPARKLDVGIRFGEFPVAIQCVQCQSLNKAGLGIIFSGNPVLLCIKCVGTALMKYQELHPDEKVVDFDVEASPERIQEVVVMLQKENPDLDPKRVEAITKLAIEKI